MKTILSNYPTALKNYKVRLGAGVTSFLSILTIFLTVLGYLQFSLLLLILLLLDFVFSLFHPKYSLTSFLASQIKIIFHLKKEQWVPSTPKRFARLCGLLFITISIFVYFLSGKYFIYPLSFLVFFSFLEASFGFCVACKIFGLAQKKGWISQKYCENC